MKISTNKLTDLIDLKLKVESITGIDELFKSSRRRDYADARCIYYTFAFKFLSVRVVDLARVSKQHHATILFALNKFDNIVPFDKRLLSIWKELIANVKRTTVDNIIE